MITFKERYKSYENLMKFKLVSHFATRMKLSTFVAILIVIALLINYIQAAAIAATTQKSQLSKSEKEAIDLAMTGVCCAAEMLVSEFF